MKHALVLVLALRAGVAQAQIVPGGGIPNINIAYGPVGEGIRSRPESGELRPVVSW